MSLGGSLVPILGSHSDQTLWLVRPVKLQLIDAYLELAIVFYLILVFFRKSSSHHVWIRIVARWSLSEGMCEIDIIGCVLQAMFSA